jgi:hypothetical protein
VVFAGFGMEEEDAVVPLVVDAAAEGVVASGVVAAAAGNFAVGVFFVGAFGASVDVEPDHGVAGVDELLGDVQGVEGASMGRGAELPDEGLDLRVGGGGGGDEGEGVVGLVEKFEGRGGGGGGGGG